MNDELSQFSWRKGQRLEFIDFRLFWEGQINRVDLTDRFGISPAQASTDFTKYVELAPRNMQYEPRQRAYLATPEFTPILYEPNARQYLADLRSIGDDAIDKERTWLGMVPGFAIAPTPRRRLEPRTLRAILSAIRGKHALRIRYQSMTRPEATERWIAPHALAYDGARWHARAWCNRSFEFRDFVLARILELSTETRHQTIDQNHDVEWTTTATMRVGPRAELTEEQRRVVALDYGMTEGVLEVSLRLSMAYYFERNLLLDAEAASLPPPRAQLTLLNRDEIEDLRSKVDADKALVNHAIEMGMEERDHE